MSMTDPRTTYSRAEYVSDAVVHVSGLVLVLVSVPVLITLTAFLRGDAAAMVGTSVYGATLILMILCSGLYNIIGHGPRAWLFQRLDHSAIYAKIAGTYTPFALLSGQGGWLLTGLWLAALVGMGAEARLSRPLPRAGHRPLPRHGLGGCGLRRQLHRPGSPPPSSP